MKWTKEDRNRLLDFKNNVDSDDIRIKEIIKKVLLNNKYIIHVLNNKELEELDSEPDDYFNVNILPYYMVTPTQTNVQNFLCYTVSYKDLNRNNSTQKYLQITFVILCEQKNSIDKETGIARHDLLAALIQDQFNFTNYFGRKIQLFEDTESIVDSSYSCRTLIFEQITDNNLVKTKNGVSRLINKDIVTLSGEDNN